MPNTLIIAEATRRQIGGLFDLADLGPQVLAGFAEPQRAWRVIGERAVSRFQADIKIEDHFSEAGGLDFFQDLGYLCRRAE